MKLNRREFLTTTVAGAGTLAMAGALSAAEAQNPYAVVPLGNTGLKVTRIGMGTGMRGGGRASNHTRMGQEKFTKLIRHGYDRGIRLFDCADMYGTHPFLANAMKGIARENYAIVSKIWMHPGNALPEKERPDANVVVDRFRKELNTDYIDLVLIHCLMSPNWPEEQKRQMEIMEGLKQKGIIKAHGVSIHCRRFGEMDALKACATTPWVDSVHTRINHTGAAMDGKPEDVVPVLKQIKAAGKGIVGMKIIGEGKFTGPEQRDESIKFVLGLGCVDTMIVGFETIEQVDDFETRVATTLKNMAQA